MENIEQQNNLEGDIKFPEPEKAFEMIMLSNVLEDYKQDMTETGFSQDEVISFIRELGKLAEEDQRKVLSLPFELRKRALGFYKKELDSGNMNMERVVEDILSDSKQLGFDLGYHVTLEKIRKNETDEGTVWDIKGLESDHRDGDLSKAYYSRDYENIYKGKRFNYIYIVRASADHSVGADGKWYRAGKLPIVSEIEMNSVNIQDVYDMYKEYKESGRLDLEEGAA